MAKGKIASLIRIVRKLAETAPVPLCDRDLLEHFARSRDQSAFETLVSRHSAMVLGVCRRELVNFADAEDATQAVFLLLAKKASDKTWQPSVAGWLYDTARKVSRNARVAATRRAAREARASALALVSSPADDMTARELLRALDEELDRLPRHYREPLILCYLEGLTRDEAALRLGVQPNTIKMQLERGRKKLADALTRRGCTPAALLLVPAAESLTAANLSRSILATVTGTPSESVAALAQGVTMNGFFPATKAALAAAFLTVVVGLSMATGEPETPVRPLAPQQKAEVAPPKAEVAPPKAEVAPPKAEARRDRFGDPLPDGAVMRLGTVRFRMPDLVGVGFRETGELVALGSNWNLRTWPADGGSEAKAVRLTPEKPLGRPRAMSADGRFAAGMVADPSYRIVVWEISGGKAVEYLTRPHRESYRQLDFSPNGEWLAVDITDRETKGNLLLGHLPTREWTVLSVGSDPIGSDNKFFSFTPDGKRLAVTTEEDAVVVDLTSKTVLRSVPLPGKFTPLAAISPDGGEVLIGPGNYRSSTALSKSVVAPVFAAESGTELRKYPIRALWTGFAPDGTLWAGDRDALSELAVTDGKTLRRITVPASRPARFSPDGKRLAVWGESSLALVDIRDGKAVHPDLVNGGPTETIVRIVLSPDGKFIATSDSMDEVLVWNASTGERVSRFASSRSGDNELLFLPDSAEFLRVGTDSITPVVYDAASGKPSRRFAVPEGLDKKSSAGLRLYTARSLRLSADGKTLHAFATSWDKSVPSFDATWEVSSGKFLGRVERTVSPSAGPLSGSSHSPDGVWTVRGGMLRNNLENRECWIATAYQSFNGTPRFSDDGRLVAMPTATPRIVSRGRPWYPESHDSPGGVVIYDLKDRVKLGELPTRRAIRTAFSPDARMVGVLTFEEIAVWEIASGKKVWAVPMASPDDYRNTLEFGRATQAIAFTPDGRRLVTGHGCAALVWDLSGTGRTADEAAPKLTAEELANRFEALADEDPSVAHRAAWELIDRPAETVTLLTERVLLKHPAEADLKRLHEPKSPPTLAETRVVMILERLRTPEARKLLEALSRGTPEAVLTREAIRSLERLKVARDQ